MKAKQAPLLVFGDDEVLADGLRAQFRNILLEADEWRPLARYVREVTELERRRNAQAARTYAEHTTCTLSKAVALKIAEDIEGLG